MKKGRFLSLIMAVVLIIGLLPLNAFAASNTGTGISVTTNPNHFIRRVNHHGSEYTYKPPLIDGKWGYCVDFGYSYNSEDANFRSSYSWTHATGAEAEDLFERALLISGMDNFSPEVVENAKWLMSYINQHYTLSDNELGAWLMTVQTYLWDNMERKAYGDTADAGSNVDDGGYADVSRYERYKELYTWLLTLKAEEDADLQRQVDEYAAEGREAYIAADPDSQWAVYATSSISGRQGFFNYNETRRVYAGDRPDDPEPPDDPPSGEGGAITITKRDSKTNAPLAGATYRIEGIDQAYDNSVTTGRDGMASVEELFSGSYKIYEENPPEGYLPSNEVQTVHYDGERPINVTFLNDPMATITITKEDADRDPAWGIFDVYRDNQRIDTIRVDGTYTLSGLDEANYTLIEVSCPGDFILDPTPHSIHVDPSGDGTTPYELTIVNHRKSNLTIHKSDADDGTPVPGTVFLIRAADGSSVTEAETGPDGTTVVPNLPPKVYEVVEKSVPEPYLLNDTPQLVTAEADRDRDVYFENHKRPSVTIVKEDSITHEPLANVPFQIWYGSNHTDTGEINDLGVFRTNELGRIVLTGDAIGLRDGWFKVKELEPPAGYSIKGSDTQEAFVPAGKSHTFHFENQPLSALVIYKYDEKTGAALEGAVFQVRYLGGTSGSGGTIIGTYRTSQSGTILLTGLKEGSYIAEELRSSPYHSISTPPQTAYISGKEQDVTCLYFGNQPYGSVLIKKLSDDGNQFPLEGAVFLVTDDKGTFIGNANGEFTTGKDGAIQLPMVPGGTTVVAREIHAPEGFAIDGTPQTVYVQPGETHQLTFYNKPLCTLTVLKRDSVTKTPLARAEFFVRDGDGTPIGANNGIYTTGSDGTFTVTDLQPNSTVVVSEEKAPNSHVTDRTPKTITVRSGVPNCLTFDNMPLCSLTLSKVDSLSGKPIPDTIFTVKYANGEQIGRYTTGKDGTVTVTGLLPGSTVVVTEYKVPDTHVLNTTPQTITLKSGANAMTSGSATGTGNDLIFENDPKMVLTIRKYIKGTDREPLKGVCFKVVDGYGKPIGTNNGVYYTDSAGEIVLEDLEPGTTVTAREISTVEGFVLDGEPQTVTIQASKKPQEMIFWNAPIGNFELVKVVEGNESKRIPNVTFEIRRASDGGLVDTITTGSDGRAALQLDAGDYYAMEIEAAKGFRLDDTPHYFTVEDGKTTILTVTNAETSGILLHKIDSTIGEGIYGVPFLLYDSGKNPIGQYTSDDKGYIHIEDLTPGRYYLRELENEGYVEDTQLKTVYVKPGETTEVTWKNTPITGQFQIYKYAAEYNEVTGTSAGTPLKGAVYEIISARSGKVVDYITTDARGVAASKPLPLGRYQIKEVTAPAYWQLDGTVFDETLEFAGQIIKLSAFDKPSSLGVTITKRGNAEVLSGSQMRYDFTIANTSNVPLENFYWHDRIPTDAARATVLTTGTYSARLNYRVLYKTNYSGTYQVLASNLLTSSSYSFSLNAIPLQAGEVVTDVYFDFGKVPVGFQSTVTPTLSVQALGTVANGYQVVNRADAGGKYQGTWQTAQANWVTIIRRLTQIPALPKTGY